LQSVLEDRPGTADIEANETRAAGSVYTSAVHVDFRLVQEELLHASGPVVDWPGIDPDQKSAVVTEASYFSRVAAWTIVRRIVRGPSIQY